MVNSHFDMDIDIKKFVKYFSVSNKTRQKITNLVLFTNNMRKSNVWPNKVLNEQHS